MSETLSSKSRDQDKDISLKTIEEWQMEVTPVYLSVDVLARLSVSGLEKKDFKKGNRKHEDEGGGGEEKEHDEDEEAKPRKGEKMVMARLVMTLMVVEEVEEEEEDDNRT